MQHDLRIFLKALGRIIAAGATIYRTRWSFLEFNVAELAGHRGVRMNRPRGTRHTQDREGDKDGRRRNGTRVEEHERGGGYEERASERVWREGNETNGVGSLEWAVLQIAPPALETPATTTSCSSRGPGSSAEFLTRTRTRVMMPRRLIGRTWPGGPVYIGIYLY